MAEYRLFEDDFVSRLDEGVVEAVTEDVRTGPVPYAREQIAG